MRTARVCKGLHPLLRAEEFNPLGVVVLCLDCLDTFQIRESTLEDRYLHAPHISPEGPGHDVHFFILDEKAEQ